MLMISGNKLQKLLRAFITQFQHRRRKGNRRRSHAEPLEVRTLLSVYSVTNLDDAGAGSLRDAINQANAISGPDTILFDSSLRGTISLTSGSLQISNSVTIRGRGANLIAVSGGHQAFNVFDIDNGNSSLINVTLRGLTVRDGGDGTTSLNGAGIFSRENLRLDRMALVNNDCGPKGGGGGLAVFAGSLNMTNCTVAGNRSGHGGGIELAHGAVSGAIVNSTISGNQSMTSGGGIRAAAGDIVVRNSTITGNRADSDGSDGEFGGGVIGSFGSLTLHNTIVAGNFRGTGTTADDVGNLLVAGSSHNLIGNHNTAGGLHHNVSGNHLGINGAGTRPIATILNTTLAGNGGPTQTHVLVTGSVAINAGLNTQAIDANGAVLTRDQRGGPYPRILGTVDIGAIEFLDVTGAIVVDSSSDINDGNLGTGEVSLREAIALANLIAGANTITFAATTNGQPIDLSDVGPMRITETLTITGNGAANTLIDGQERGFGMLEITAGAVTLERLTLRNGSAYSATVNNGGAILSTSPDLLTISESELSENYSFGNGGAIHTSSGAISISRSTLAHNTTYHSGGGICTGTGAVTISRSTFYFNGASDAGGGITSGSGAVNISESTLTRNIAVRGSGGGINVASGAVNISKSILTGNASSDGEGGAINASSGAVSISRSTLSGNYARIGDIGGGGGGALFAGSGAVSINQSTLSGNVADFADGGAIFAGSGTVRINQSTLSGNSAIGGVGGWDVYYSKGGAICTRSSVVIISQSTLTGNRSTSPRSSDGGGAVFIDKPGKLTIRNSIVAGNSAPTGADLLTLSTEPLIVTNSLIGRSDGTPLTATGGTTPDANGNFIGGTWNAVKIDPGLGPLSDNGGPTQTHALLPGSRAINRGNNSDAVDIINGDIALTTDQRGDGFSRIHFQTVDMGAFESSDVEPFEGSAGNDDFVVTYSRTATSGFATVTVSSDGGPITHLGTFSMVLSLTINGLGGTDSVRIVGTDLNDTFTVAASGLNINGSKLTLSNIENRTLAGNAGRDIYKFDADEVLGLFTLSESGIGTDTIDFSSTTTVGMLLRLGNAATQTVHATNLQLALGSGTAFENAIGGDGADTLIGNSLNNTLTGGPGNDRLSGGSGDDVLVGGLNDDTYLFENAAAPEADMVRENENEGIDTLNFVALTAAATLNLGSTVVQNVHTNRTVKLSSGGSFENTTGGSSDDLLIGNALNNQLKGGDGDNMLIGNDGDDFLLGGSGQDILIGDYGADRLDGAGHQDILIAGWRTVDDRMNSSDITNIRSVLTEWTSASSFADRIAHLRGGAGSVALISLVAGSNIQSDTEVDILKGGLGIDWYFIKSETPNFHNDKITDFDLSTEVLDLL